jgi:hypothetical protein
MSATHVCPIPTCRVVVPNHLLMCGTHWRMVPRTLQDIVYRHYRSRSKELPQHQAAAIAAVTRKLGFDVDEPKEAA